jgi:hypothetical protein
MPGTNQPIACRLDALSPDERRRQQTLRQTLEAALARVSETLDGYVFTYRGDSDVLLHAAEWLALERRCCPFLDFELAWPADAPSPSLRLGGAPTVKAFIAETFVPTPRSE